MSTETLEATYQDGVLHLSRPLDLADGARVDVMVTPRPVVTAPTTAETATPRRTPAEIVAEIAALAVETEGPDFSGRDHDKILYGAPGWAR